MEVEIPDTLKADTSKRDSRYEELKSSDEMRDTRFEQTCSCLLALHHSFTRVPYPLLFCSHPATQISHLLLALNPFVTRLLASAFILFASRDSNLASALKFHHHE